MPMRPMIRIRTVVAVAALAVAAFGPSQANASLIGDTVNGVEHYDGFAANYFDIASGGTGASAVVGAGIEFSTPEFLFPVRADLGAFDLFIIHSSTAGAGGANGFTVDLSDLDFGGGAIITGVNLVANGFAGFADLTFTFGDHSIHVDVDPYAQPGSELVAHFQFVTSVVPEPTTLALLALGLGALGFVRRKQ